MAAAYIEHRPKSTDKDKATSHYVIVTDGVEKHGEFSTQKAAKDKACAEGLSTSPRGAGAPSSRP